MSRSPAISIDASPRLLLAFVVSVSILQTPLPMAHAHSGIESSHSLATHLARHHGEAAVRDRGMRDHEIHWHFVLPCDFDHDDDSDDSPHRDAPQSPTAHRCSLSPSGVFTVASTEFNRLESDRIAELLVGGVIVSRDSLQRIDASSTSTRVLTSSQRVCALLCVIRC